MQNLLSNELDDWNMPDWKKQLFEQMYERLCQNWYDEEFDPMEIVDNDYINYCDTITKDDDPNDWELLQGYEAGDEISHIQLESGSFSTIEAISDDNTAFLVRI